MTVRRAQRRRLMADNQKQPVTLREIPREQWPPRASGATSERLRALRSRDFLVQEFRERGHIRLSVNRCEWDVEVDSWREDISWDDLQRLKAEAGYADRWAVEVFPPASEVVNVANMRHIWLLDEPPPYGWHP